MPFHIPPTTNSIVWPSSSSLQTKPQWLNLHLQSAFYLPLQINILDFHNQIQNFIIFESKTETLLYQSGSLQIKILDSHKHIKDSPYLTPRLKLSCVYIFSLLRNWCIWLWRKHSLFFSRFEEWKRDTEYGITIIIISSSRGKG